MLESTWPFFLTLLFNRALAESFPPKLTMNIVASVHKGGDPIDLNTYRTIMISHMPVKLYGEVMETWLCDYIETLSLRAPK